MTLSLTLTQILREEWKRLWLLQGSKTDSDKETKGYLSGVGWELRNACRAKQQLNIRKTEPSSLSYSPATTALSSSINAITLGFPKF